MYPCTFPIGLGLVVEEKPSEFLCTCILRFFPLSSAQYQHADTSSEDSLWVGRGGGKGKGDPAMAGETNEKFSWEKTESTRGCVTFKQYHQQPISRNKNIKKAKTITMIQVTVMFHVHKVICCLSSIIILIFGPSNNYFFV